MFTIVNTVREENNPYQILDVMESDSLLLIRKKYLETIKKLHSNQRWDASAAKKMQDVIEAYKFIFKERAIDEELSVSSVSIEAPPPSYEEAMQEDNIPNSFSISQSSYPSVKSKEVIFQEAKPAYPSVPLEKKNVFLQPILVKSLNLLRKKRQ